MDVGPCELEHDRGCEYESENDSNDSQKRQGVGSHSMTYQTQLLEEPEDLVPFSGEGFAGCPWVRVCV
jgi:hypothetical protein